MENKKQIIDLTPPVLNLDTFEKAQKFYECLINPNPANEKIRKMIKESPPIPRRKREY